MFKRIIRSIESFVIKSLVIILVSILFTLAYPYVLFTDGPSEKQKVQYPWLTSEVIYWVDLHSQANDLDPDFVLAVINAESEGKRTATSCVGAIGYMQVMPFHMKNNPERLYQAGANIAKGCSYLSDCLLLSGGDMLGALKNYNAGPASKFYNIPYLKKITRSYLLSKNILLRPGSSLTWDSMIGKL